MPEPRPQSCRPARWGAAVAVFAGLCLAACGDVSSQQSGDPARLVFAFAKQKDPAQIQSDADALAQLLSDELGMPVEAQVPLSYAMTVQAMVSATADVAYFDSLAFLLARRDGDAELLLAEVRPDIHGVERTDYDSIFVVAADSDLQSIEDLVARASSLRFAFTSPTSTSGYLMAVRRLVNEGLIQPGQDPSRVFGAVVFGGSYTQALEQVADGRADVCAVSFYTMEGPRADVYLPAEQREKLRILARTPNVPTHIVAVRGALTDELKAEIKAALVKISREHPQLLADVYGASSLTEVDEDEHVRATVEAMRYIGRPLDEFVK